MVLWMIALAGLADYLTATVMIGNHGIGYELNPFVVFLYGVGGLPLVGLLKAGSVLLFVVAVIIVRPYHPRLATFMGVWGIALGLIGAVSNTDF